MNEAIKTKLYELHGVESSIRTAIGSYLDKQIARRDQLRNEIDAMDPDTVWTIDTDYTIFRYCRTSSHSGRYRDHEALGRACR